MGSFIKLVFLVGILGLSSSKYLDSSSKDKYSCHLENTSFQAGEEIIYKLYYNWKFVWIPAGEIKFSVQETENEFKYNGVGKSYTSYDNFFRVRDYYESTVDKKTLKPKHFVRYVEEGDYRKYDSLSFDYESYLIHSYNGKTKEEARYETFSMDTCQLDLLSVMYYLRNINTNLYQPGDAIDIEMFFDREVYPIHIKYLKKEVKKIKNIGKCNSILIQPQLIVGNIFKEGDVMKIWVSDDENKIPLMIESPISVGSVKGVLKQHSGLRYGDAYKVE